jgi:outer membrane receptor protein involved in Fe transport
MNASRIPLFFLLLIHLCCSQPVNAEALGTLSGTVRDAKSGEPLPGVNVVLVGTGFGASTDANGRYNIRGISAGEYPVKVSFVGYQTHELKLTVDPSISGPMVKDFRLLPVTIEGEEITVSGQAIGQNAAISQQLVALPVMNVVSAAKIQDLPDMTAADAVGRLPGVSLITVGGEGTQVIIRGMAPQYNQVTIEGVELPSDIPSNNNITSVDPASGALARLGDRAEDLSMISSSMLGGIEVVKAITPDMDATLIGGTINFTLRRAAWTSPMAPRNQTWVPSVEVRAEGGYNGLKNTRNDYRLITSLENRFFDESLGIFLQGSLERRNLSDNTMSASLMLLNKAADYSGIPAVGMIVVNDNFRTRERKGATIVLDYQHDGGEIDFFSFFNSGLTRTANRNIQLPLSSGNAVMGAGYDENTIDVLSNLLTVKQDLPWFHVDLKLSQGLSENLDPLASTFNFQQRQALLNSSWYQYIDPEITMSRLALDAARAGYSGLSTKGTVTRERLLAGYIDLRREFTITDGMTGSIKIGGMIQRRSHSYEYTAGSGSGDVQALRNALASMGVVVPRTLSAKTVYDPSYFVGKFLDGVYPAPYAVNVDLLTSLAPEGGSGISQDPLASKLNNYDGYETKSAGYAMATLSLGDDLSIVPGVRYQNLTTHYTGFRGMEVPRGVQGKDTTVSVPHGLWLPMVHVKYQPTEWLQLRAAYTNTLVYSDYSTLSPRYMLSSTGVFTYNNFAIKPATSENIDLVVALHSNEIGLLSFNGFRKRISGLVFFSTRFLTDLSEFPDLPQSRSEIYQFSSYVNNKIPVDLYGLETEWQTNFWYLPGFLSGFLLNVNYTHIFSEAKYPKSIMQWQYLEDGTAWRVVADTFYTARLLGQPNDLLNLMLGYDYAGFSVRISFLYQDNIFRNPDFWPQLRTQSGRYGRWDLSVKQELPWAGLQVYVNVNNLNTENDVTNNTSRSFPVAMDQYGLSAMLGVRVRL